MKCRYKVEDEEWREGEIVSVSGDTGVYFYSLDEKDELSKEVNLHYPQISFRGKSIFVTGFQTLPSDSTLYQLTQVEVQFPNPGKEKE